VRNSSRPGDLVLDPFAGSGTTLIAAEKSGRVARLIELDPKYVDVIVQRWEAWTGQTAVRAEQAPPPELAKDCSEPAVAAVVRSDSELTVPAA
jgi:hypothetical protein